MLNVLSYLQILSKPSSLEATKLSLCQMSKQQPMKARRRCSSINGKLAKVSSETQHNIRPKLLEEYINKTSKFL